MSTASLALESTREVRLQWMSLPTMVGFYLATRLCVTYFFFQSEPQLGAMVSFALNVFLLLVVSFYSFSSVAMPLVVTSRTKCFGWILAFLGYSLLSLLWSETVSVSVAIAYWTGMAADVLMILLLVRSALVEASLQVIRGYTCGACVVACVMWLSPTMQDLRPGNDEFFSPNAIGFTCAFGMFFAQYLLHSDKSWRLPAVFLAISLLRSLSKTTIAAFVLGQLVPLTCDKTLSRRSKMLLLSGAGIVIAAFWSLISAYYLVYINAGNQAETLTGRIGIWGVVLERSLERPWFGHGFHSFRNVIPPFGSFEAWHAHNEILQQFYAYGVVGIVLLFGLYGSFFLQVRGIIQPVVRSLFMGLITFIAVRGLGDTERFDLSFPLWSITLLSLMLTGLQPPTEVHR